MGMISIAAITRNGRSALRFLLPLLNCLSVVLRLTKLRHAAYPIAMQIVEQLNSDPVGPSCCECHKSMWHVGTETVAPEQYVLRRTFECACGVILVEEATLH